MRVIVNLIVVRITPARVVVLVGRIHRVEVCDRASHEGRVIKPALEGVTGSDRRCDCDVRILDRVAGHGVRVRAACACRDTVVHVPLHRIALCRTPLRVVVLVLGIHRVEVRDRCAGEAGVIVPAEEVIAGSGRRSNRCVRIQNRVARNCVRVRRRMACRCSVIQIPLHGIGLRRAPLCVVIFRRGIRRVKRGDRRAG